MFGFCERCGVKVLDAAIEIITIGGYVGSKWRAPVDDRVAEGGGRDAIGVAFGESEHGC